MATEQNDARPSRRPAWRRLLSAAGWVIGLLSILVGIEGIVSDHGYPPNIALAIFLLVAGGFVLPPITALARRAAPILRPVWAPAAVYLALFVLVLPIFALVTPRGAGAKPYIDGAIARADADLKAHDVRQARSDLEPFADQTPMDPAIKAALARADAEEVSEQPTQAQLDAAKVIELRRVNDIYLNTANVCIASAKAATGAVKSGDLNVIYQRASEARLDCEDASMNIGKDRFSEAVPEPVRDRLNADLTTCASGFTGIEMAMGSLAKMANGGDSRPSAVAAAERQADDTWTQLDICAASYKSDMVAAGVPDSSTKADAASGTPPHHHRRSS